MYQITDCFGRRYSMWSTVICLLAVIGVCGAVRAGEIAYWEFNDKPAGSTADGGERIVDSSANARDLYVKGAAAGILNFWDANPNYGDGAALNFTTLKDEVIFEPAHAFTDGGAVSGSWIELADRSFTFEAVIRLPRTQSTAQNSILRYVTATNRELWVRIESNNLRFAAYDGAFKAGITSGINFCDGQWRHIALVFVDSTTANKANVDVYVDYNYVLTATDIPNALTGGAGSLHIGNFQSETSNFVGSIDFVRFSEGALSVSQFINPRRRALNPSPANYQESVAVSGVALSWDQIPGASITSNTITVARDEEMVNVVDTFTTTGGANSVNLGSLENSAQYYWRVDTEGSDPNGVISSTGDVWTFSTVETNPTVAGFWTFDDKLRGSQCAAGDIIYDISGNNRALYAIYDGEFAGESFYGNPPAGYAGAASYDGAGDYKFMHQPGYALGSESFSGSHINVGSGSFTIEALIKQDSTVMAQTMIMTCLRSGEDKTAYWISNLYPQYWFRVGSSGLVEFSTTGAAAGTYKMIASAASVRDNQWHHVAAVRDGASQKLRLYVDYTLAAEDSDLSGVLDLRGKNIVAGRLLDDTVKYIGEMGFAKFTKAALTPAEFEQALCLSLPSSPYPEDGAVAVVDGLEFSWTPAGCGTITSQTVVIASDEYMTNVLETITASGNTAVPTVLESNNSYYWRVDTVIDGQTIAGSIWTFSAPRCLIEASSGDINGDCAINNIDLAIMAANWLRMNEFETINP